MITPIDDGGPIAPIPASCIDGKFLCVGGALTPRDWLAGLAMQGFCCEDSRTAQSAAMVAKQAYEQADAMIAAGKEGA